MLSQMAISPMQCPERPEDQGSRLERVSKSNEQAIHSYLHFFIDWDYFSVTQNCFADKKSEFGRLLVNTVNMT